MEIKEQTQNNDFVSKFLEGEKCNGDWIRVGRYLRRSVPPPKLDTDTKHFKDGLVDTIKQKLEEALLTQRHLTKTRKRRIKLVLNYIPEEHRWFYFELEAHLFSEYYAISRWTTYWLGLWDTIHDIPLPKRQGGVSEKEINKAKNYPVESLYKGKLRKSGSKLSGVCPFYSHE